MSCGSKDNFEEFCLSREGVLYTFTKDHLFPVPRPPLAMGVASLKSGGRFYGQITDANLEEIKIGLTVELCLRKLHEGEGFRNYFWKIRPLRNGKEG